TVKFVRILIDLENAVMRVEIPYADEPEVSLVHLTGVSLQVIGLGSMPAKTSYRVGETLNTSGLSLEAHYTNGMTSVLRDGFSVSQPIFSEPGEQTVTLDYCGQMVDFTVTVTDDVVSGDADQSGTLDLRDIALLKRSLVGGWDVDLTDVDVDVNKDGEVNLKDAVLLRRYLAGGWGVELR
ncbi:MAG: bacterial Ig-like domain-containing protein, partial [Clostridiales bacterium]|nr:bacterial Ig-like domain-containing protein [Clostridiales bacterium]